MVAGLEKHQHKRWVYVTSQNHLELAIRRQVTRNVLCPLLSSNCDTVLSLLLLNLTQIKESSTKRLYVIFSLGDLNCPMKPSFILVD